MCVFSQDLPSVTHFLSKCLRHKTRLYWSLWGKWGCSSSKIIRLRKRKWSISTIEQYKICDKTTTKTNDWIFHHISQNMNINEAFFCLSCTRYTYNIPQMFYSYVNTFVTSYLCNVILDITWPVVSVVSAGPEQAPGSGPADQGGRVGETRGRRLQAAGAAGRVLRHGRVPGHLQPEAGNHRPHRSEDPQRAVRYQTNGGEGW